LDDVESLDLICVDWVDAVCSGGPEWQSIDEIQEVLETGPSNVRTVGMLVKQTADYVAVCDTIILDGSSAGSVHIIPSGMVKSLRKLTWLT
jgi:hypothetical protein